MKQKIIAAGILGICPETERVLMIKRRYDVEYPGMWAFPGGVFEEKDGYPKITAIREFREETGYDGVIKVSKEPLHVDKSNHLDFYTYVGILPNEFIPNLKGESECGDESLDSRWVKYSCKNKEMIPEIVEMLILKEDVIKKIINKFKNKNYE